MDWYFWLAQNFLLAAQLEHCLALGAVAAATLVSAPAVADAAVASTAEVTAHTQNKMQINNQIPKYSVFNNFG
jgi:hypothetical protein